MTPGGFLTTLFAFAGTNGAMPSGLVKGSDGNFYGTTEGGGLYFYGVIFQLIVPPQLAAPAFSPTAGPYVSAQTVAITSAASGASIAYTTDGSTPTEVGGTVTNGILYRAPVSVGATTTLKAIAFTTGFADSPVAAGTYLIAPFAAAPVFNLPGGTYGNGQTVTITSATGGASIAYTTDGSTPTEAGGMVTNGALYGNPVPIIAATTNLNAIAFANGYNDSAETIGTYTITNPPPVKPIFSPSGGTYTGAQSVTITSTGATAIYYTTDGSIPTTSSNLYTTALPIAHNIVLQAIGANSGGSSLVASASFMIFPQAPAFSLASGTYADVTNLSLVISDTASATIYYTTDGTTPTAISTQYSAAIALPLGATTINAIAVNANGSSAVSTGTYVLTPPPPLAPVFSPSGGSYTSAQSVAITSSGPGTIYYTTDGSTPTVGNGTPAGATMPYAGPVAIGAGTTVLQAVSVNSGGPSPVATASFTILLPAPVFSPAPGTYTNVTMQSVTISDAAGAAIYYTTNGTTPTAASTPYMAAVSLSLGTTTLNAIAIESGFPASTVTGGTYTIINVPQVAAPVFSSAAGSAPGAPVVAIASATSGASIRYTTDGTTPSKTNGTPYSGPVSITAPVTLRAIAFAIGYSDSAVTSVQIGKPTITIINP